MNEIFFGAAMELLDSVLDLQDSWRREGFQEGVAAGRLDNDAFDLGVKKVREKKEPPQVGCGLSVPYEGSRAWKRGRVCFWVLQGYSQLRFSSGFSLEQDRWPNRSDGESDRQH